MLGAQLERSALVTLAGPAGVGKTRLAIEVARQAAAPDGVWLVRLDAADAHDDLAQAVAETLHLPGERMLLERLAGTECLLVLDNCEHVVGPAADLASLLLDAAPRLTVLATSQLPLGLDGESVYPVEPLPITESVAALHRPCRRRSAGSSCSTTTPRRSSRRSAGRWTGCRWRSSWRPPG